MDKISAVIITNNEEQNIERCLRSIDPVVDEIIVVDSNSTDNTGNMVKRFAKAQFITHNWEGYSRSKNFGNNIARYDWILSIDADEELSPELQMSILKNKENLTGCYKMARLTYYCGTWIHHSGWYPDAKIRLFDRRNAKWIGESIHEKLVLEGPVKVNMLKGDCFHFSIRSIEDHLKKINLYSSIWAKEAYMKGKKFNILLLLFKPFISFFTNYFIKLGFLDGYHGFLLSVFSGFSRFMRLIKLRNMYKNGTV